MASSITAPAASSPAPTAPREGRLRHVPALDGLRALAVVAVMLYHDGATRPHDQWVPGGFLGVDVFFVLSGFLITGILLTNRDRTGRTATKDFWIRRARRLLPALLLMLLLCAAWGWFAAPTWELASLRDQSFATLLYVQNWYRMFGHPGHAPLSQTWSLSIEEQWYFVWPFLLAGLLALTGARRGRLLAAMAVLCATSAALMAWYFSQFGWDRAYGSTTARAGELLLGGILAVALRDGGAIRDRRARVALEIGALVAVGVLVIEFATVDAITAFPYRGGCYLAAIATAVIIVALVQPRDLVVGRVLGWRPIAAIGLVSYGLYLFHYPLFRWMSEDAIHLAPLPLLGLRLAVLGVLAVASYRLVERPVRDGRLAGREGVLAIVAIAVTVGAILLVTRGATSEPGWLFARGQIAAAADTLPPGTTRVLVAGELDAYDLSARTQRLVNRNVAGAASASVATIGCTLVARRTVVDGRVSDRVDCDDWRDTFRAGATALRPDVAILMAGQAELLDQRVDGRTLRVGTPAYERALRARLDEARRILTPNGTRLLLTTVPCVATASDDTSPAAAALRDPARHAWVAAVWRRYAADHPRDVTLVDIDPFLCPNGNPFPVGGLGSVRDLQGRLTPIGAGALWDHLVRIALATRTGATR